MGFWEFLFGAGIASGVFDDDKRDRSLDADTSDDDDARFDDGYSDDYVGDGLDGTDDYVGDGLDGGGDDDDGAPWE